MPKYNIAPNARTVVFALGGNDLLSGATEETSKASISATVGLVNALIPPPSESDRSAIISNSGGVFNENIVLPVGCSFNAPNAVNAALSGVTFELASSGSLKISSAISLGSDSTVFLVNNKEKTGIETGGCIVQGANSVGVDVQGTSDDIFVNIGLLQMVADVCIGIRDASTTAAAPEIYNIDELLLEADNCKGIEYNPLLAASSCVVNAGIIGSEVAQTGNIGIDALNGNINAIINRIDLPNNTAIHVATGAVVDASISMVSGDILLDIGGTLNCNIQSHDGEVINNGTINGFINGVRYGKGNSESTSFTGGGFITQGALNTQINISPGGGTIYDYSLPPGNGEFAVEWEAFVDVDLTFAATELFSFITIDRTGAVQQFAPNNVQFIGRRDFIVIGTVQHTAGVFQQASRNYISARETHAQLLDLLDCLGVINCEGFVIQPNADLSFDKTAGILMNPGAGNAQGNRAENAAEILAESPATFRRTLGITGTTVLAGQTLLDPANYDDGSGSPVAVGGGANASTIQYIFQFPVDGIVFIQYGQSVYSTLADAVAQASADNPTIPQFVRNDALLLARVAMEKGATDLTDTAMVEFLPGAKFGVDITGGSGGSGAGGGDVFGPASSLLNEIPNYADATGKILNNTSDISALSGAIQRITANGDLEILRNGLGAINLGGGTLLSKTGVAEPIGSTIWSIASGIGGDAGARFEHQGVGISEVGYRSFDDLTQLISFPTSKGVFIEANGQISIGTREDDSNFSIIIGDTAKPFGLPILTTASEAALADVARMLSYNSVVDRVRFNDGSGFKSLAIEGQNAVFEAAQNSTDTDISTVNTYIIMDYGTSLALSKATNWELFGSRRMRYIGVGTWTGIVTCSFQVSNPSASLTRNYDIRSFVEGSASGAFWDLLSVSTDNDDARNISFGVFISITNNQSFDMRIKIKTGGTGSTDGARITNASFSFVESI